MAITHRTGVYVFSLQHQDSLVAGKNFITLLNPSSSGRLLTISAMFVSHMATVASPAYPLRGYRTTDNPTGGTLAAGSDICQLDTVHPSSVAVIRYGNPTCTLGAAFMNSPAGLNKDDISTVHSVDVPYPFNPFRVRPNEAIVIRQDIGAVGHLWNISILWRESGS